MKFPISKCPYPQDRVMKKYILQKSLTYSFIVTFGIVISSCGHSAGEIADIVSERDSLKLETQKQQRRLKNLDEIVELVNGSIDSIATQEGNLFNAGVSEGGPATKEQVLKNVERLENLINTQKSRIAELEKGMRQDEEDLGEEDTQVKALVASLKRQLAQKDAEIASLKAQLNQKDVDINRLRAEAEQQSRRIVELDKRATMQQEALKRQDAVLNQCYMVIASKKDLQSRGIIRKGRLVTKNDIDRSKFSKVDIRKLTEITFNAKRPRLLTSMPESSYEITTDGKNTYTLRITNPTAFWSISNFLVIQTD